MSDKQQSQKRKITTAECKWSLLTPLSIFSLDKTLRLIGIKLGQPFE